MANPGIEGLPTLPVAWDAEGLDDMEVGVIVDEDLPNKDLMAAKHEAVVPMLRQGIELIHVVVGQIRIVERSSFDTAIGLLVLWPSCWVEKTSPQPIVAVGVEC